MVFSEIFKEFGHSWIRQVERGWTKENSNIKPDNWLLILSKILGTHGDQSKTRRACRSGMSDGR